MQKHVGKYAIDATPIGVGTFSEVYKGCDTRTARTVAVKKMVKGCNNKYVRSEIELMKQFRSRYILELLGVVQNKYHIYLILEYCSQGNLKQYIDSPSTQYNLLYIYQIISGLKYLFHKNIIHRDIKPENILIHNTTIKICDFGFAKTKQNCTLLNTFCGSPLYMAPEILSFEKYTHKADMWSLGVILYEILTKTHPYPSENKVQLARQIKSEKEIVVNSVVCNCECDHLLDLVKMALQKQVSKRLDWEDLFTSHWYSTFSEDCELRYLRTLGIELVRGGSD